MREFSAGSLLRSQSLKMAITYKFSTYMVHSVCVDEKVGVKPDREASHLK